MERRKHIREKRKGPACSLLQHNKRANTSTKSITSMDRWEIEDVSQNSPPITLNNQSTMEESDSAFSPEDVMKLLINFQKNKAHSSNLHNNQLNNVIPEFDPSNKMQSVDSWLNKVNECTVIYEWNEKQTIHFALQKLAGQAKKWYESLQTVVFTWEEWQFKIKKAFPNEQNYGRLLEDMLARTTRISESFCDYFYDKLSLINQCNIVGKNAVDCVIHGITDKSIRNSAQALNCKEPEDLLGFLNSQKTSEIPYFKRREILNKDLGDRDNNNQSTLDKKKIICFNCRTEGHTFQKCTKPLIKCQKCNRVGHNDSTCRINP
ncbi:uncharacterized protein LOC132902857 [Amyelois transitella]|uniref:uncharacterized protein LOC132902857 n=1 Tax=Amyelois transitella TaxID=680683 RepID=UPI00298F8574|nr:uncharacterized protein LOC132902857 [Amyelois transitella]